jgi:hypothetical protein
VAHNINMTRNLTTVGREILSWRDRPSGILISGDLAYNSGESSDYAALAGLLRPLRENGVPIHLALGNHDHRERFWMALREDKTVERSVADKQVAIVRTRHANWFILDSLLKTVHTPGLLGDAQRRWLAHALDKNRDKPALIVAHHNPSFGYVGALDDSAELFEILRPRKHVKAYIFGHTHRWDLSQDTSGIHLINLPPVAYLFEEERPNGWVQAQLEPDGMRLEMRCLNTAHTNHGQRTDLAWR